MPVKGALLFLKFLKGVADEFERTGQQSITVVMRTMTGPYLAVGGADAHW
jgi:hypothetical protein